ncbi:MAG TPA: serine/threonine-protein kinase [Planctomycetaceae bacterium]|nr:serine/threonine-protein kinase [Planctomycetaceae bacterium]
MGGITDRVPQETLEIATARTGELPAEFGRYRIERKLGRGGMGSVYLARDRELDRLVALKVPRFADEDGPPNLERFRREARAAATLEHPNICAVYDVGEVDGVQFLTMAYVEGRPLSDLLQQGTPLPEQPAADLVRKLALALDEAHQHGVVHRDLKPANVMINRRHEPVITDFGLARRDRPGEAQLTQSGTILGTPAYMSPEQVEGDPDRIGPPADVYSLGVMFYELLTGQRPFQGSVASIFSQVLRDEPRRPGELRPGLDPRLEAICLKAMRKSPADRYRMGELAAALADYLDSTGQTVPGAKDDRTLTMAMLPRPPVEPQAETVAIGSTPTGTAQPGVAKGEPGLATQLLAQLAARLERDSLSRPSQPDARWWRNPLVPWLAAAVVLLGLMVVLSGLGRGGDREATIRIDLAGLSQQASGPALVVLLDGRELSREELSGPIRVSSGDHELTVRRGEEILARKSFSVRGGSEAKPIALVSDDSTSSDAAERSVAGGIRVIVPHTQVIAPRGVQVAAPGRSQVAAPGTNAQAGSRAPAQPVAALPPEPVDGSLALWSQRDSEYRSNPLHSVLTINDRRPVRIESDLQHPIASDLRPGWNQLTLDTTPLASAREANDLDFRIGPVSENESGNPVMSPVLWAAHNGDDWTLKDGRHTHRIDPDAKSVRLAFRLYYAGLRFETVQVKNGDYVVDGKPDSEYHNASVTASVFVNGTGLNTFTSQPRQVVITPLLRKGHNEIRIVSARVENCLTDNDVWVSVSGPAEWNASHNQFQTRPVASISAMTGWARNRTTSRLENTVDPQAETIERVIPLYLSDEPALAGRLPDRAAMSAWSERSSAYQEASLHSELRINGRLVGVFTSDTREVIEPVLKLNDWNDVSLRTRAQSPADRLTSIKLQFGPARRDDQGELVMAPVLWWLDNGGDWQYADGRLRHQLDPDAADVTLSTKLFYAGLERESVEVARGDYVLIAEPGSEYNNPSVTATVFINGTPLNSFTSQPRQVVITPLLKEGDNEIRLVTARVKNGLLDNDLSFSIAGPARYNVAAKDYEFIRRMEFTSLEGWRRDPSSGQLVPGDGGDRETIERVLPLRITGLSPKER